MNKILRTALALALFACANLLLVSSARAQSVYGSIFGTVIGTILIGVLLNGLVIMNVSSYIQQIIIGVIIVLAVAFDTFAKSRKRVA